MASAPADKSSFPNQRLLGKVALVTGDATGIGESIVRLFHKHDAKVCIVDIQDNHGQQLCANLGDDLNVCYYHCDVTVEEDLRHTVDFAIDKFGLLDIMVNDVGVSGPPCSDIRNLNSQCLKSVASAIGGLGRHAYIGSKHAVSGLTKNVAAKLGNHSVRVNCVSPYAVATSLALAHLLENEQTDEAMDSFRSFIRRTANLQGVELTAHDVANAVLFLASDEARYISGANLMVDGGTSCL